MCRKFNLTTSRYHKTYFKYHLTNTSRTVRAKAKRRVTVLVHPMAVVRNGCESKLNRVTTLHRDVKLGLHTIPSRVVSMASEEGEACVQLWRIKDYL